MNIAEYRAEHLRAAAEQVVFEKLKSVMYQINAIACGGGFEITTDIHISNEGINLLRKMGYSVAKVVEKGKELTKINW